MLRTVLDTNVVVSSLWPGTPRRIMEKWHARTFLLVASPDILCEYLEVLGRFHLGDEDFEEFLVLFTNPEHTLLVQPKQKHKVILADPADDMFLDCAQEGQAHFIVSGDSHLLELGEFHGIPILRPVQFLKRLPS